jgi:hypothetical protein
MIIDFDEELEGFLKRIVATLDLFTTDTIAQRKEALRWISSEKQRI